MPEFIEQFADEWGPEYIIQVYDSKTKMKGILAIDNTALGPGKGGIRMTPSVTVTEVFRLARAMTWKNALAELPFGGAKSGIIADPKQISENQKADFIKAFAKSMKPVIPDYYIAGPDINTTEKEMGLVAKTLRNNKASTGKPKSMGGIPHELGSTGFGVAHATTVALKHKKMSMDGATIAVEGFGNVGTFTIKYLSEWGAKIVASSDSKGVIYNQDGLDYKKLMLVKKETGSIINYRPGQVLSGEKIFELPLDVLIPGALPDVITNNNVEKVRAKIVVEAANIPTTPEIEERLHKKGILVVPDFAANAGGVISSYVEFIGKDPKYMFKTVEQKIKRNVKLVLESAERNKVKPRDAALKIAQERVRKADRKKNKL